MTWYSILFTLVVAVVACAGISIFILDILGSKVGGNHGAQRKGN